MPEVRAVAEHRREAAEHQQEDAPAENFGPASGGGVHPQRDDDCHERRPQDDLPSRAPPHQGVEQDQDGDHGVEAEVPCVCSQLEDREQPGDAPPDQGGHQGAAPPPEQGRHQRQGEHRHNGSPGQARRNDALDQGGGCEHAHQQPVETTDGWGVSRPRLMPDRAPDSDHGSSLGIGAPRRTRRKNERQTMPSARRTPASGPMCPPPGSVTVDLPILSTTTEPMMRTPQPTATLEDQPIPVRAKLAAAWTSFMFLYIYLDILNFFTPGVIEDILDGRVFEFDLSQTFSTTALTLVAIPILMVVLSMTLPARVNRIANLVVA